MKNVILSFLFFSLSFFAYSQDGSAPKVINIDEVNFPPSWKDCETEGIPCTFKAVQFDILRRFNSGVIPPDYKGAVLMNIKFIIDTAGKVAWARATGPTKEIEAEGIQIVKNFKFSPGKHEGKPVNVLVDFPLKLNLGSSRSYFTESPVGFREIAIPPTLGECQENEKLQDCTSAAVQKFSLYNTQTSGLSPGWHETTVRFIINKEGKVQDIMAEGLSEKLNHHAIEMIEKLPRFRPGQENGEPVDVVYVLPMKIQSIKH